MTFFAAVQDSNLDGAGYETAIKGGALAAGGKSKPASKAGSRAGTKKVSKTVIMPHQQRTIRCQLVHGA
jgi:hypothetical protein